jgi:hypothetical protein
LLRVRSRCVPRRKKQMFNLSKPKFVVVLFASVVLQAACGGSTDVPRPTDAPVQVPGTSAPPAAPAAASALSGDPKAAMVAAMKKQLVSGPYRSTTTIVSDGVTSELTGEMIPPDRLHVKSMMAGEAMEMIYVGDQSWAKRKDGAWEQSKIPGSGTFVQFTDAFIDEMVGTMSDVAFVGPGEVNGTPAWVYSYTSDLNKATTMKMDSKSAVKVWIGVADGLIYKQEIDGEAMGIKSKTTQVVAYDAGIKIEAPVK